MKKSTLYLLLFLAVIALFLSNMFSQGIDLVTASEVPTPSVTSPPLESPTTKPEEATGLVESQAYSSRDDVARYLFQYGKLPPNYFTKAQARELGWIAEQGNLWEVTDQGSIGGDRFSNREKLLPEKKGRIYYECDIDYSGGHRGAKRIVFSNDGLIYYTDDHYESFEEITREDL